MARLLPRVLANIVHDSLEVRLESVYAFSGFAFALNPYNKAPQISRSLRYSLQTLIGNNSKKQGNTPYAASLLKIVEDAALKSKPTHFGQSPCWALTLVSSMIIILDYTLFFHPYCVKLCFSMLYNAANHKRPGIRALHSHLWKLLIWAFRRIPTLVNEEELGDVDVVDIRKRALKVLRQENKNDIGLAFVSSLLQQDTSLDVIDPWPDSVEDALGIVQDMLRSSDNDTRRNGVSIFRKLFTLNDEPIIPTHPSRQLLCRKLFDGSLLNVNVNSLSGVAHSFPIFMPESVRQLTNEEVYDNWSSAVSVWVSIALVSLQQSELELSVCCFLLLKQPLLSTLTGSYTFYVDLAARDIRSTMRWPYSYIKSIRIIKQHSNDRPTAARCF